MWFYGYLISVFPEHFVSVYSDYLKAENTGKQMLNVASQMQYTLAIIFNEKFSEKDVLESGKKDLENIFDKSTEVYNYFTLWSNMCVPENPEKSRLSRDFSLDNVPSF